MPIGEPFVQLIEVDSTNNYATRQVQAHLADHGATWFAHTQNAGKGQRGKTWISQPGENIVLSCVINPKPLTASNLFILSAAVALACHDFYCKYALEETKIKWPNDIYWKDRKAGGILIENLFRGKEWTFAIVGIGLNINQVTFPPYLTNPVSLRQITGKTFDACSMGQELCVYLENRWQQVLKGDTTGILQDYHSKLYKLNETITLKIKNADFTATLIGVNDTGELLINDDKTALLHGEVEWII